MRPPPISEKAFQKAVIDFAEISGWRVVHFRPAMNSRGEWRTAMSGKQSKGWPDLILVRDRVIFAELKTDRGRMSPDQISWNEALTRAGAEAYIFMPSDWPEIERTLAKRRERP